jgi:hypothetical protein
VPTCESIAKFKGMFGCQFIFYYFLSLCLGVILSQINFFQPNSTQIYSTQLKKEKKKKKEKRKQKAIKKLKKLSRGGGWTTPRCLGVDRPPN